MHRRVAAGLCKKVNFHATMQFDLSNERKTKLPTYKTPTYATIPQISTPSVFKYMPFNELNRFSTSYI
jgi:hypothetical protein